MTDQNSNLQVQTEKKGFTFGFSKTKPKINLSLSDKAKEFQSEPSKPDSNIELIKSIEGKKVNTVNKTPDDEKKKPLVIPCAKNNLIFDIKREEIRNNKIKAEQENKSSNLVEPSQTPLELNGKIDDLTAIAALIADSKKKLEEKDKVELKIPLTEEEKSEKIRVEEPDYEKIDLEKFGLAALRGMGWSEKSGMGLSNKRSIPVYEPELRPKGLGLGAGSGTKKLRPGETESDSKPVQESTLKYVKGAYVQILNGKHANDYGQIVSFDDGLNRIIVKLASDDTTISLIQNYTKLLSKNDYLDATERKMHRK
jgi:hypothetical protein